MIPKRLSKTLRHSVVGGLAGLIMESGLEAATGLDFVNGVLEIAGATMGAVNANRDLIEFAYDSAVQVTGKPPTELTNEEWDEVRKKYPRAVEYLERALAIRA